MIRVPTMLGVIERRLLVNYRVDLDVLRRLLPAPLRPQVIGGTGMAGICLIRLGHVRPAGLPAATGVTTENAAHRVAVEWDGPEGVRRGVYIPRRDTSSRLTLLLGGHLFPGKHHHARFRVREAYGRYEVAFASLDGTASATVVARPATAVSDGSVFRSVDEASKFFPSGPLGYSACRQGGHLEGLELRCATWHVEPLAVETAESSFFQSGALFPAGAAELDSALVMRNIPAIWQAREPLPTGDRHGARAASEAEGGQCVDAPQATLRKPLPQAATTRSCSLEEPTAVLGRTRFSSSLVSGSFRSGSATWRG